MDSLIRMPKCLPSTGQTGARLTRTHALDRRRCRSGPLSDFGSSLLFLERLMMLVPDRRRHSASQKRREETKTAGKGETVNMFVAVSPSPRMIGQNRDCLLALLSLLMRRSGQDYGPSTRPGTCSMHTARPGARVSCMRTKAEEPAHHQNGYY